MHGLTSRSAQATAAFVYVALSIAFVFTYERFDDDDSRLADAYFTTALLVQPVLGFLAPRWWALLLPYVALAAVLPFSKPDPEFFGVTDAGLMFGAGFFGMVLVAFGAGCRLTLDMLREPR